MKLIWKYLKKYIRLVAIGMMVKLLGTLGELSLPYILEHIIDNVVPIGQIRLVIIWGLLMIMMAVLTRFLNVRANRMAAGVSRDCIYEIRRDLFVKTANLTGAQFDAVGLPSLTSRMTSDSYNVQNFIMRMQTMGVRGPIMLIGGIFITLTMDWRLAMILIIAVPILLTGVMTVSVKGTPLFDYVQNALDTVVRIMRENITGIRVVKALSREEFEKNRYQEANEDLMKKDIRANAVMALPGPFMQLCLNIGLTIVIIFGAQLVDRGVTKPGVILAFLSYFNLILMAVMGLNRIFVMYSKAAASAQRMAFVMETQTDLPVMEETATFDQDAAKGSAGASDQMMQEEIPVSSYKVIFDHVGFSYASGSTHSVPRVQDDVPGMEEFSGGHRQKCLDDISFRLQKGESLGIIGATGSGKTTVMSLLMRFYDAQEGRIFIDGHDVRTYDKDELHRKFGVVFQNDIIFADTLEENIRFGRDITFEEVQKAARAANADGFIREKENAYQYEAAIKGANLSGGQKQRILIARALAANPEILILDDSSSALDYKTDAAVRKAIREVCPESTMIMIAQRISSVMGLDHIMVLEDGKMLDYGSHEYLMEHCEVYRGIYQSQMGEM